MKPQFMVTFLAAGATAAALNLQYQSSGSPISKPLRKHQTASPQFFKRNNFVDEEDQDTYIFPQQETDHYIPQDFEFYQTSEFEEDLEFYDLSFDPENILQDDFEETLEIGREALETELALEENESVREDTTESEIDKKDDGMSGDMVGVTGKFWDLLRIFSKEYQNYEQGLAATNVIEETMGDTELVKSVGDFQE